MKFRIMYFLNVEGWPAITQRCRRAVVIEATDLAAAEVWAKSRRAIVWAQLREDDSDPDRVFDIVFASTDIVAKVMSLDEWCALEIARAAEMDTAFAESVTACQNCGGHWHHQELEVDGLDERAAPGEPMPAGECPSCGALCQPVDATHYLGDRNG
jgi:hypothetical protein